MKNSKKIIKIIIVVMLVICLICGILIYKLNKQNNNEDKDEVGNDRDIEVEMYEEAESQPQEEYQLEKLKNPSDFFSVEKCIQNNIDENFIAKEMNILDGDRIISYAIYGYISNEDAQTKTEKYFILRNDIENETFSIEEQKENYDNIDQIDLKTNLQEIKSDGNNIFEYINMSEEQICMEYYERFSKLELENPEEAYELLEADYKKERFPTLDEYQKYVNEYKDIIEGGVLSRYSVEYKDDYTEYVLVDVYNNSYTIQATSVMEYTIKLDNYTIKVDDYEEKYQELKDENKVQANVHIFLQMINTKDYKHAYGLLDESFRQSNFDTLEKFEQYVKNNFFSYNLNSTVSSELSIKKEGEYYIYNTVLRNNSSSAAESKKLTIIMKLKQGTDFVMSFSL